MGVVLILICRHPPPLFTRWFFKNQILVSSSFSFYTTARRGRRRRPKVNDGRGRQGFLSLSLFSLSIGFVCVCVGVNACHAKLLLLLFPPWEKSCGRKREYNSNGRKRVAQKTRKSSKTNEGGATKRNEKLKKKREWKLYAITNHLLQGGGQIAVKRRIKLRIFFFCFLTFWWNGRERWKAMDTVLLFERKKLGCCCWLLTRSFEIDVRYSPWNNSWLHLKKI